MNVWETNEVFQNFIPAEGAEMGRKEERLSDLGDPTGIKWANGANWLQTGRCYLSRKGTNPEGRAESHRADTIAMLTGREQGHYPVGQRTAWSQRRLFSKP